MVIDRIFILSLDACKEGYVKGPREFQGMKTYSDASKDTCRPVGWELEQQ